MIFPMSRFIIGALVLSLLVLNGMAQNPYVKVYGGNSFDDARGVTQMADGGYVIAGSTGSFDLTHGHFMLIRIDAWGSEQWRKYYGAQFSSALRSMAPASDGGYLLAGITETLENTYQVFAVKVNADGDTLWTRHFGGAQWDLCNKAIALTDGGYALAGQTFSYGVGQGDAYLIRLDADGDTLWTATYGGTNNDAAESIAETYDGGFILAGHTESSGAGQRDLWLVRLDGSGNVLWEKTFGGEENEAAFAVLQTSDGGFAASGSASTNSVGEADFYMLKVNASGQQVWEDRFGGPKNDEWLGLMEEANGDLVAIGYSETTEIGGGGEDVFIKRVSADGWFANLQTTYGLGGDDRGYQVIRTADNGYAIIGKTDGYMNRLEDALFIKTDASGLSTVNSVLTGISNTALTSGTEPALVFPNPFRTTTNLKLDASLWASDEIKLEVYCPIGRLVDQQSLTREMTTIDMSDVGPGAFVYRILKGSEVIATGRLIHLP